MQHRRGVTVRLTCRQQPALRKIGSAGATHFGGDPILSAGRLRLSVSAPRPVRVARQGAGRLPARVRGSGVRSDGADGGKLAAPEACASPRTRGAHADRVLCARRQRSCQWLCIAPGSRLPEVCRSGAFSRFAATALQARGRNGARTSPMPTARDATFDARLARRTRRWASASKPHRGLGPVGVQEIGRSATWLGRRHGW